MVQLATVPGNEIFILDHFGERRCHQRRIKTGENMMNFPSPMMDINSSPVVAEFDEWDPVAGL